MKPSSVCTVAQLVLDLGETVARVVAGGDRLGSPVERVVIHERSDDLATAVTAPGAVLLGVSVDGVDETLELTRALGELDGVALLLRQPVPEDEAVLAAAHDARVALVEVSRATSWMQLASLAGARLGGGEGAASVSGGPGELSELATGIGALLDAPVTIEDRSCRVLAFSVGEQDADEGRRSTVLAQQVPEHYRRLLTEQGVFRELYRSETPVYVPSPADDCLPRLASAVRAGDEVLGFLWAVMRERPDERTLRTFADCANTVALELLRRRSALRAADRVREEAAATMLDDSSQAARCAQVLGMDGAPCRVLAISEEPPSHRDTAHQVRFAAEAQRLATAFALYLSAVYPSAVGTSIGGVVYGVVPSAVGDDDAAERVASGFLDRMRNRPGLRAGIGRVATSPTELPRSRADAEAVLHVLGDADSTERFAAWHTVRVELMLRSFVELHGPDTLTACPVAELLAHDELHGTDYARTLDAYLTAFGDVAKASSALHVHQNTFRYRLGRLCQLSGLDLADPDARLAATLDLRAARLSGAWPRA